MSSSARGRGQRLERVETRVELRSATPRRAGSDRDRRAEAVGCGGGRRANGAFVRRRAGLNHGRSLHVTCQNASTNQGPGTHAGIWMDRRFFVPGTVCDSWFLSIRAFFFFEARLCLARCSCEMKTRASECLRDCSDSRVEPIANVAVLLRTLRPIASASTLRRERQGRRGVREARASPLRDLSRRRRTGSRPTAVSRARPSRARGS